MSYDDNLRLKLIMEVLGGECEGCASKITSILRADHRNGDGKEDRQRFDNNEARMWKYYLEHPDEAREKLQPLCLNCHHIKSRLGGDYTWRRTSENQLMKVKDELKDSVLRQLNILLKLSPSPEQKQLLLEEIRQLVTNEIPTSQQSIKPELPLGYVMRDGRIINLADEAEKNDKALAFMQIFRALAGGENQDVDSEALITKLIASGKFSSDEARKWITKFSREGQIFERKPNFWAKS